MSTQDVQEESADIEKLSTECRRQMLEALLEITDTKKAL